MFSYSRREPYVFYRTINTFFSVSISKVTSMRGRGYCDECDSVLFCKKIMSSQAKTKFRYLTALKPMVTFLNCYFCAPCVVVVVVVVLLFYAHGKHLRSFRDGQLT